MTIPPDVKYKDMFLRAFKEAREREMDYGKNENNHHSNIINPAILFHTQCRREKLL